MRSVYQGVAVLSPLPRVRLRRRPGQPPKSGSSLPGRCYTTHKMGTSVGSHIACPHLSINNKISIQLSPKNYIHTKQGVLFFGSYFFVLFCLIFWSYNVFTPNHSLSVLSSAKQLWIYSQCFNYPAREDCLDMYSFDLWRKSSLGTKLVTFGRSCMSDEEQLFCLSLGQFGLVTSWGSQ